MRPKSKLEMMLRRKLLIEVHSLEVIELDEKVTSRVRIVGMLESSIVFRT